MSTTKQAEPNPTIIKAAAPPNQSMSSPPGIMQAVYAIRNAEYTQPIAVGEIPYSSMIRVSPAVAMLMRLKWLMNAKDMSKRTMAQRGVGEMPYSAEPRAIGGASVLSVTFIASVFLERVSVQLDPEPRGVGAVISAVNDRQSSTSSSRRSGDSASSMGRNSMYGHASQAAARCALAAIPIPLFQQCGTIRRPRSAAIRQTRMASVKPPTRPTSG